MTGALLNQGSSNEHPAEKPGQLSRGVETLATPPQPMQFKWLQAFYSNVTHKTELRIPTFIWFAALTLYDGKTLEALQGDLIMWRWKQSVCIIGQ